MGVCVYRTQHACMLVCLLLRAACVRCDVNYLRFVTTPKKQIGKANRAGYELLAKCHVRKATTFMKEKRCVPLSLCLCLSLSLSLSLSPSLCLSVRRLYPPVRPRGRGCVWVRRSVRAGPTRISIIGWFRGRRRSPPLPLCDVLLCVVDRAVSLKPSRATRTR